ncbi:Striatin-interacting protein 1-like protein [Hypsibius exemplaris]|uniref:Striatin-interacting protein 1-like protein n=1 Tax=Hypsibius exemplaris TaxID=2072580 RepID=A0A1W0W9E9_HYPEX|nr:Striatin-interacting protein 1-like protein [Hypsibius exemplaris]
MEFSGTHEEDAQDAESRRLVAQCVIPVLPAAVDPLAELPEPSDVFTMGSSGLLGGGITRLSDTGWSRFSRDSNGPDDAQGTPSVDDPDLAYAYDDSDTLQIELAEVPELSDNHASFCHFWKLWSGSHPQSPPEELSHKYSGDPGAISWTLLDDKAKDSYVEFLLEQCERSESELRSSALRAVLYLIQGSFWNVEKDLILDTARENAFRFYRLGSFQIFVQLLLLEADVPRNFIRTPALSIADSKELRSVCNILYSLIELIRRPVPVGAQQNEKLRAAFIEELSGPIFGKTILLHHLFELFMKYASGSAPHYPLKKLLLLIWKVLLVSCGGMEELRETKNQRRQASGLAAVSDDTLEVARKMRASTPPLSASEMADGVKRPNRPLSTKYKPSKDSEANTAFWFTNVSESDDPPGIDEDKDDKEDLEVKHIEHPAKRHDSQPEAFTTRPEPAFLSKSLPWNPKVRQEEIDRFIRQSREKFVGVVLPEDTATLVGLPKPIEESIQVMRRHVYVSLSDVQTAKEEGVTRFPMSQKEEFFPDSAVERVYQALLPQMGNHVIALLKVLLASSPTSKTKTESVNVVTDVLPEAMPTSVVHSMRMGIDTNRHKEIIVKAVSGIVLLLLKHFKVNHVYQFETLAQHLVMANCMALILKFLNQNTLGYVVARNQIPALDYPACCGAVHLELTKDQLEFAGEQPYCWRNLHACINLIRILNKLAKWKKSRVLVLVLFKSAAILKRALRIRNPIMQLYTLKALKLQSKFLGRQWRRLNMRTLSAIYEKVRHRLMDDWAYGNVPEHEVKKVDCQIEERKLRVLLDSFNNRRYHEILRPNTIYVQPGLEEFQPMDHNLASALSMRVRLPDHFKANYESWLEREVYGVQIDWDQLIETKNFI